MIHSNDLNWLISCSGLTNQPVPPNGIQCNGDDLINVEKYPVILNKENKIMYSPHEFISIVGNVSNVNTWNICWGYIRDLNRSAVTVSDWCDGQDSVWINSLADYMIDIDATDNWFWCLNADNGDCGGLVEFDWQTPVQWKLNLLHKVQPNPTKVIPNNKEKKIRVI